MSLYDLYDICVVFLIWSAAELGISYREINIYLFVVIQPALILLFFVLWLRSVIRIRRIKKRLTAYYQHTA